MEFSFASNKKIPGANFEKKDVFHFLWVGVAFLSIFQSDSLHKLISPVWMSVEKNRLVRWTRGVSEIHFLFLNFFL